LAGRRIFAVREALERAALQRSVVLLLRDLGDLLEDARIDPSRVVQRENVLGRVTLHRRVRIGIEDLEVDLRESRPAIGGIRRGVQPGELLLPDRGELAQGDGGEGERVSHRPLLPFEGTATVVVDSGITSQPSRAPAGGAFPSSRRRTTRSVGSSTEVL